MKDVMCDHDEQQQYATITLNRPEKLNAISKSMVSALTDVIEQTKSLDIKCLIITGAGDKMFSAGGDLTYFHSELSTDQAFERLYTMKDALYQLVDFPVPTIALLNGNALGGGCELATACDLRLAKEGTQFGFVQTTLGIVPGWGGGVLLYEKVDPHFALQWLVEGVTYSTAELLQAGWLHKIIQTDEWSNKQNILRNYLNKTVEQMKHLKFQYKQKLATLSLAAMMNEEVRQSAQFWGSPIHQAKIKQIMTKK